MTSESNKYLTWECTFIFGSGFTSHVQPGQTLELVHIPEAHADCVLSRSVVSDSLQPLWTIVCQAPLSMGFSRQEY